MYKQEKLHIYACCTRTYRTYVCVREIDHIKIKTECGRVSVCVWVKHKQLPCSWLYFTMQERKKNEKKNQPTLAIVATNTNDLEQQQRRNQVGCHEFTSFHLQHTHTTWRGAAQHNGNLSTHWNEMYKYDVIVWRKFISVYFCITFYSAAPPIFSAFFLSFFLWSFFPQLKAS